MPKRAGLWLLFSGRLKPEAFVLKQVERQNLNTRTLTTFIATVLVYTLHSKAQIYDTNNNYVQIFAGSGVQSYLEGTGTQAMFYNPTAVVADSSSNLFVLDTGNSRIRKITPSGVTSTFVGGGAGSLPGFGTSVSLSGLSFGSMVIDHSNIISVTAFSSGTGGGLLRIYTDGYVEFLNFTGMNTASGISVDSGNNLYYSTFSGNRIYRLGAIGNLTLFAGNGSSGSSDGNGIFASFNNPGALAVDAANNVYVWDSGNHLIRRIDQSQNVTTIAGDGTASNVDGQGTGAKFNSISAMTVDNSGNVIMACGSSIRRMSASTNVTTIAGSFSQSSYANGLGALARFSGATGIWLSQGMMFVADSNNQRIRQISFDPQPQLVADSNLGIRNYAGITITGLVGRTYQIQSSPNMTNWTVRTTLLLTSSPYLWFDQNPVSGNKFYRALLLP